MSVRHIGSVAFNDTPEPTVHVHRAIVATVVHDGALLRSYCGCGVRLVRRASSMLWSDGTQEIVPPATVPPLAPESELELRRAWGDK